MNPIMRMMLARQQNPRHYKWYRGGSDGSTLNLDFTQMSELDSRFTFSRSSTATVINSNGLVQYADHNFWFNTRFDGISGTEPTLTNVGWQYVFSVGSCVFNGDGSVTISTASGTNRRSLARTTSLANTTLRLAAAIDVVAHTGATYGTLTVADIFVEGSANDVQFYVDGTPVASSTVISGPCTVTWVFEKTGGGTVTPCFGINVRSDKSGAFTLRFARPRFGMWGGVAPFPYFENTSSGVSPSAYYAPRFDYDPTTLAPRGLLIEGSVTNLITYSNASTTGWTGLNATGSNDNATSPDGTTSATLWTGQSGGQNRAYSGTFNVTSGSAYTVSAWFKKPASNGSRYVKIYVLASNESSIGWPSDGVLDLNTGTASGTGFTVTAYSNNWYRVVSTGTANSTTTARAFIAMCTSTGGLLTTTESMLVWGCQAEAGSAASSYIPTGASTAQRAAESCSMTGTNFSSWYNQSEGTVLAKWRQWNVGGNEFAPAARFALASGITNSIWIGKQNAASAGRRIEFEMRDSSGTQRAQSVAGSVTDPVITAAGAQKFGDTFGMSYNGNTTVSTVQTRSPAPDRLFIGSYDSTSGHINSTIARLVYWPTRLPDATLQSLTQ